jgi:hypothetical protein
MKPLNEDIVCLAGKQRGGGGEVEQREKRNVAVKQTVKSQQIFMYMWI